jgi:hypothetical protein
MMRALREAVRRSPVAGPIADLATAIQNPALARRLLADARRTRAEMAFARELPPAKADAPLLLVLSMSNNVYIAKLECMLAIALRRRGWRIQILTSSLYMNARRIYGAFGFSDLVAFEKLLDSAPVATAICREATRRRNEPMDFRSVMAWTYRDAWIGPQLLSSVSRQRFEGAPDPRDQATRAAILDQLATTLGFVHAAEHRLTAERPDLILVNEPNYHVLGPFVDVAIARNIPAIHFIQPSRDDGLIFKRLSRQTRRIHPNSITRETLDNLLAEPWTSTQERELDEEFHKRYSGVWRIQARNQPGTADMTREEVGAALGLDPSKRTAVLFSHVLWDANLFYGEDLFDNYGHWFAETVAAAVANPRLNWIIKLHPANLWKRQLSGITSEYGEMALIRERVGKLPSHVRVLPPDTKVSTLSLFRAIDAGITVRGSIGYELPCFGVPVVTAGTGRYSEFDFTLDHGSAESYLATLARLEAVPRLLPETVRRAKVHAHALFVRRPWILRSFALEFGTDVTDPLYQNLHSAVQGDAEIAENGDLDAFADWAADFGSIDYLASAHGKR